MNNSVFKASIALILVCLSIVGTAGCSVQSATVNVTETPSASPAEAAVATAEPTPAATVTPAPTPTPEPKPLSFIDMGNITPEQKDEADRICQQFLNAEGPFTVEALCETAIFGTINYEIYHNDTNDLDPDFIKPENFYLGTLDVSDGAYIIMVQEVLLFTVKSGDRFFMICGAEDKEKKRFINPVEIPVKAILTEDDKRMDFFICTKTDQLYGSLEPGSTYLNWTTELTTKDMQEIIDGCSEYVQRPVFFYILGLKPSPDTFPKALLTLASKRYGIARNFAASVYIPDCNRSVFVKYLKRVGKITGKPVTISTIDDLNNIDLNKTLMTTGFIAYKK